MQILILCCHLILFEEKDEEKRVHSIYYIVLNKCIFLSFFVLLEA